MRLGRNPLAWANLVFLLFCYALMAGLVLWKRRPMTSGELTLLWPLHVMFAVNLLAILRPPKR
jgi:hypothetical protein